MSRIVGCGSRPADGCKRAAAIGQGLALLAPGLRPAWLRRQCAATSRPVFAIIESELTPVSKRLVDDLNKIKAARKRGRRKRFSRLDMYREQISMLAATGGSTEDIRIWLRQHASVMVARSTVWRALARWKAEGG